MEAALAIAARELKRHKADTAEAGKLASDYRRAAKAAKEEAAAAAADAEAARTEVGEARAELEGKKEEIAAAAAARAEAEELQAQLRAAQAHIARLLPCSPSPSRAAAQRPFSTPSASLGSRACLACRLVSAPAGTGSPLRASDTLPGVPCALSASQSFHETISFSAPFHFIAWCGRFTARNVASPPQRERLLRPALWA